MTFTEGVTISATYNIAPAFGFNADIAIFNRALTATEKALLTRYMQRGVPVLGTDVVTNGTFDSDTWWTKGTNITIADGVCHAISAPLTLSIKRDNLLTVGTPYIVQYDVSNWSSGTAYIYHMGSAGFVAGNGTTRRFYGALNTTFSIANTTTSTFDLDNVMVYQIL